MALIGAPNAGKSTLMNALVGAKLSIVTHKVQTTRSIVRGIAINGPAQIILVDTPGIFAPRRRLDRAMVTTAWGGAEDADIVCLLVDAQRGLDEANEAILEKLSATNQPKILVLNKIDTVRPEKLLVLAETLNRRQSFSATFMVSSIRLASGTTRNCGGLKSPRFARCPKSRRVSDLAKYCSRAPAAMSATTRPMTARMWRGPTFSCAPNTCARFPITP